MNKIKVLILFGLVLFSGSLIPKTKLIYDDMPVFKIGNEIYFKSDAESTQKALKALKCIAPNSVLLRIIGLNKSEKKYTEIIRIKKILKLQTIKIDDSTNFLTYKERLRSCDQKLTPKEELELSELYLYERTLKEKFGSNSYRKTKKSTMTLLKYIRSIDKKLDHNVFL